MKKLIAVFLAIVGIVPLLAAQDVVTGTVVDKDGNPLPGVKIEIPGTPEMVISDLDGTFSITRSDLSRKKLLATYAGMSPRKVKMKDGMVIRMKEYNWWTKSPDEWNWFANAVFAVPNAPGNDFFNPAYGVMVGRVKKFGYYVKGVTNTFGKDITDTGENGPNGFIDKQTTTYWSATGGAMLRLGCPIHLYLGVGYAEYTHWLKGINGDWYKNYGSSDNGLAVDLGFILRINRVNISLGITTTGEFYNFDNFSDDANVCGNFGIGYSF